MYDMMRLKKYTERRRWRKNRWNCKDRKRNTKESLYVEDDAIQMCGQAITVNDTFISGGFMGLYFVFWPSAVIFKCPLNEAR